MWIDWGRPSPVDHIRVPRGRAGVSPAHRKVEPGGSVLQRQQAVLACEDFGVTSL